MRNVACRRTVDERDEETKAKESQRRPSVPVRYRQTCHLNSTNFLYFVQAIPLSWPSEEECAPQPVSGRLEIRVVSKPVDVVPEIVQLENGFDSCKPRPKGILKSSSGSALEPVNCKCCSNIDFFNMRD